MIRQKSIRGLLTNIMTYGIKNMWSRYVISLLMAIVPVFAIAQEDPIMKQPGNGDVKVPPNEQAISDREAEFKKKQDSLCFMLQEKEYRLHELQDSVNTLRQKNKKMETQLEEADKRLRNIVTYFAYHPYEASSIEKVVKPSYKAISSDDARKHKNCKVKYDLLCNYGSDVHELDSLYKVIEEDLDNDLTTTERGRAHVNEIKASAAYTRYQKYSDWGNTYLGKNMMKAITRIKQFSMRDKDTLKDLIEELDRCIATEEDLE